MMQRPADIAPTIALALALALALILSLGACSLFSTEVDQATRQSLTDAVPKGSTVAEAQSAMSGKGFSCVIRKGPYLDSDGREHAADRILACTRRPGRISMNCANRDQVFILIQGETTGRSFVTHGPSCGDA